MKMREIILDFTSLLDVILIILFWFIIQYRTQMQEQVQAAQDLSAAAQAAAQEREAQAEERLAYADTVISAYDNSRHGSNSQALVQFGEGEHISLRLHMEKEGWRLDVGCGDSILGSITDRNAKKIGQQVFALLEEAGYPDDATILCVFTFDSSQPGTRQAYAAVSDALHQIKMRDRYFYCTEEDLADYTEEMDP